MVSQGVSQLLFWLLSKAVKCLALVVQGHPASGKSSLARQLARQTGFALSGGRHTFANTQLLRLACESLEQVFSVDPWLLTNLRSCCAADKDDSRNCFHALELDGQQGFPDLNNLSYAIMLRVAGTQLACGNSVICDGPLSRLATFQQASVIADEVGCSKSSCAIPL